MQENQNAALRFPRRPKPKSYRPLATMWMTVGSYSKNTADRPSILAFSLPWRLIS